MARKAVFDEVSFIEEARTLSRDPVKCRKFYDAAAKQSPRVALALSRFEGHDTDSRTSESLSALIEEARALISPLATSQLFTSNALHAASQLLELGDEHSAGALRHLLQTAAGSLTEGIAAALARFGTPDDFAAVRKAAGRGFSRAIATLAQRGDPTARTQLCTAATTWLNGWKTVKHTSSSEWDEPFLLVDSLGAAGVVEAVPALLELLETPCVVHAFAALERLKEPRAADAARRVLKEVRGDRERVWPYHLAAQSVLAALGDEPSLDTARDVLANAWPRRYGWPKLDDVYRLEGLALHVLLNSKNPTAWAEVAPFATSHARVLRDAGRRAAEKLGTPGSVVWADLSALEGADLPTLKKLLAKDNVVFKHNVARRLGDSNDAGAQKLAAEWALGIVEGRFNHPVDYFEECDLGPEVDTAIDILKKLHTRPALAKRIAVSESRWVRRAVFDEQPVEDGPPRAKGPVQATVRRLDEAPFVFGAHINGLAYDHAGKRLAVVMGDAVGVIVDASTGAQLTHLQPRWRWAFDAAFSPDDSRLAVAYHGGHLALFDPANGKLLREYEGFGGVPDAARKVAWSKDGRLLGATGSDGSARLFDVKSGKQLWRVENKGSFEAVLFTADGTRVIFSRVKGTNELHVVDLRTKKARVVKMPWSVWALLENAEGQLWAGGEGKEILLLDAQLKPVKGRALKQAEVVRLAWAGDGSLMAASQQGDLQRWDVAKARAKTLLKGEPLWALCTAPDGSVATAGTEGTVSRFTADGSRLEGARGAVHTEQVRGIAQLPGGDLVSAGWDGRLIRWSDGVGTLLHTHKSRFNCLALSPDGKTVYAGVEGALVTFDLATNQAQLVKLAKSRVEDLAVNSKHVALTQSSGRVALLAAGTRKPVWEAKVGDATNAVALTDGGHVLAGAEHGSLYEFDLKGKQVWSKREHGRDLVDKDPMGDPHRNVVGLDVRHGLFASAGTDDSLRVFDVKSHQRRLLALVNAGLFNNCAFSPSGARVAVSTGEGLVIFDVATNELLCALTTTDFPVPGSRSTVTFPEETRLLLGSESGAIMEVRLAS